MSDLEKNKTNALEAHHTGSEIYEQAAFKIPNIIRLSQVSQKIRENKDRVSTPETEKDDIEEYLVDTQAKIIIFRQLISDLKDSAFEESLKAINDWDELFQDLVSYYYKNNSNEFHNKVVERIIILETKNPKRQNMSYRDRLQVLLGSEKFKRLLTQKLKPESSKLGEVVTKEFIETANSLNTFKIIKRIEPEFSREFNNKTLFLEKLDFGEIKTKVSIKIEEANKIKQATNPDFLKLRQIDKEIKILLAPILRKIALVYRPEKPLKPSEGTAIHEVLINEQAACGGASEIIRLLTEYLGLKGRSVYYPGHVNYEIYLPSGDILLADNNGNFGVDPQTGEAKTNSAKFYKTLRRVRDIKELSEAERKIAYRRLNNEGKIEYYLPEDGSSYAFLQFGRTSSQDAVIPQAIVNNMQSLFITDIHNIENRETGLMFINQTYLENNPFGLEMQTGIPGFPLSEEGQRQIFEKMLSLDIKTIATCQNLAFLENQILKLEKENKVKVLLEVQEYLSELLAQDAEFFLFLNLYTNLYLFEKMLLEEGIGNKEELKTKIKDAIEIFVTEISKFPIEPGNSMNREYNEKIKKLENKKNFLQEMLQSL